MPKQLLRRDSAFNLEELQTLVAELVELYGEHHPSTIYLEPKPVFSLEEETLTDGSKVLNLRVESLELEPPTRVLVALEGGVIQGTVADRRGVEIIQLDYDSEGADPEDLYAIPQDGGGTAEAWRSSHGKATCDPAFIDRALAAEIADPKAAAARLRSQVRAQRARAAELELGELRTNIESAADLVELEAARLEALLEAEAA